MELQGIKIEGVRRHALRFHTQFMYYKLECKYKQSVAHIRSAGAY